MRLSRQTMILLIASAAAVQAASVLPKAIGRGAPAGRGSIIVSRKLQTACSAAALPKTPKSPTIIESMINQQQREYAKCMAEAQSAKAEASLMLFQIEAFAKHSKAGGPPLKQRLASASIADNLVSIMSRRRACVARAEQRVRAARSHKRAIAWLQRDAKKALAEKVLKRLPQAK